MQSFTYIFRMQDFLSVIFAEGIFLIRVWQIKHLTVWRLQENQEMKTNKRKWKMKQKKELKLNKREKRMRTKVTTTKYIPQQKWRTKRKLTK